MAYNPNYDRKDKGSSFDPDTDYSALIKEAAANGDMAAAAEYEQQRNEKIDALGLDYEKTNDYSQYYKGYDPSVDYSALMGDAAANKDYIGAAGYEQQRNEKIDGEGLDYSKTNRYTPYADAKKDADGYYDQYMNREPFRYDLTQDPLYQQYKEQFMSQGKLAMQDTMAQAAALTGGYGNSYAQTAGQQMYDRYLGQINDIVPELYNAAYSRWQNQGNDIYEKYQAAQSRADAELSKIEESAAEAYDTAITLISNGIMPEQSMLNDAGIPWEMALNYWKIANGEDYVAPGTSGNGTAGYGYSGNNTYTGTPEEDTSLMDLAAQYAAAHPGGQVDSLTVDIWLNNQGLTYEDKNKVKNYLVQEGFDYRYKP